MRLFYRLRYLLVIFFVIFSLFYVHGVLTSLKVLQRGAVQFTVHENESLRQISDRLQEEGLIDSPLLFRLYLSWIGKDNSVGLGVYKFDSPQSIQTVAEKLVSSEREPLLRVTIPEGSTTKEIATRLAVVLPQVNEASFTQKVVSQKLEGKLFPETYFLLPSTTEDEMILRMNAEYEKALQELILDIQKENKVAYETTLTVMKKLGVKDEEMFILTLASLIQGEGKFDDDMYLISDVLWKRLQKGMRLQVDVAKETYKVLGVPKAPINNPGITALRAAYLPKKNPYLYYISEEDGTTHYATTFQAHTKNIQKYLR